MGIHQIPRDPALKNRQHELVQSSFGYLRRQVWTNPALLDADGILNDTDITSGPTVTSFLAQPQFARRLSLVASDTYTGNAVITGTNIRGEVITETIALTSGTPVTTLKAFKTVTSIAFAAGAVTVDVGWTSALGLDRCMSTAEVLYATLAGAREATHPTVTYDATDVSKNTVLLSTALDGIKDLVVAYIATEKTTKVGTTA